ncbi:unnamed protein product [Paramecium sonneborni]|uniref:H(+)-exporting diphosphatase n=1 Tax=Paramecium sonneborni TaxID=65129 RepID=A0A8S1N1X8_9CILI|nr:unnamed protein product [Paramecium sonneborni]
MHELLQNVDNYIQLGFASLSILFFYIVYQTDTFMIQNEENWDYLRQQYAQLYEPQELDKFHFPNEMASFCYKIQEKITSIQWEYIYFICLSALVLTLYSFFFLESGFLYFGMNIVFGGLTMFYLCYFINNVYLGTVVKVPLRTDPLRWAYGNGFFLSLFCLGMLIISTHLVNQINKFVFNKPIGMAFVLGGSLSLYFRREQQSILGRSISIGTDLHVKDNLGSEGVMDVIGYSEKLASIMGHILSDNHLLDLIVVLLLYFTLPRIFQIGAMNTNVYSIVMLINYFAQFIISFFISSFQSEDIAKNVLQNIRTQIIAASLFSIISLVLLYIYNSTYMSIASFGLITSMLLIIYLEYVTNHSFPQVRNIASAALNAPMLNVMNGNFLGDMGQLFFVGLIGLFIFISKEIGGNEGLYAFLTGLIMNAIVMTSIQFSGNSINIGLRFAQIAQVDSLPLEKINLAACNYALYLKTITIICLFLITIIFFPIQEIQYFGVFLGIILAYFFKGIFLKFLETQIIRQLRGFYEGTFLENQVYNLWELTGLIGLQFIILNFFKYFATKFGMYSYVYSYTQIVLILSARAIITGSSLKNVRVLEGTLKENKIIYLSHMYADIQGISMEESPALPQIGFLGISIVLGLTI